MNRFFAAAAAACLLAATPALAAHHDHDKGAGGGSHQNGSSHETRVQHTSGLSRTVRTTHVDVIRGGHEHSRTVRHVTVTRTVHAPARAAVNYHSYRRNFSAPHRYHFGVYRRPSGWYAHRWVYGERVPRGWYGRDYWIGNYVSFGLIGPPDGYQWVRVGDDALLVDVDTGEVLQVEYGVFY